MIFAFGMLFSTGFFSSGAVLTENLGSRLGPWVE